MKTMMLPGLRHHSHPAAKDNGLDAPMDIGPELPQRSAVNNGFVEQNPYQDADNLNPSTLPSQAGQQPMQVEPSSSRASVRPTAPLPCCIQEDHRLQRAH
jgi:hypothetical protein